jgi:divalent metal cation (Fe/Co/Zn/Cd) transporter
MIGLFLILTILNLLCLLGTAVLGYGTSLTSEWSAYHQLAGALATICCCAVHCVVFTYFIATAKWIQHAVTVKKLSTEHVGPTRSFKAQAFPAALFAMASVFGAAIIGVITFSYHINPRWHQLTSIAAIVINAGVAWIEYRAIRRNGQLVNCILDEINPPTV